MTTEYITSMPTATPDLSDYIMAVQGYSLGVSQGTSVKESLLSVSQLLQSTVVLTHGGNPNGSVAGYIYQMCWDSVNHILYVCTTTGNASSAVWSKSITLTGGSGVTVTQNGDVIQISASSSGVTFNNVTGSAFNMVTNNAYQANHATLCTLTLPTVSAFGDVLYISGYGVGGWLINQGANQQIIQGTNATNVGVTGNISSTYRYDGIQLYCVVPDLVWKNISAPQGTLSFNSI